MADSGGNFEIFIRYLPQSEGETIEKRAAVNLEQLCSSWSLETSSNSVANGKQSKTWVTKFKDVFKSRDLSTFETVPKKESLMIFFEYLFTTKNKRRFF